VTGRMSAGGPAGVRTQVPAELAAGVHRADFGGGQPPWPAEAVELWAGCAAAAARRPQLWRVPAPRGDDLLREQLAAAFDLDPDLLTVVGSVRAAALTYARRHGRVVLERPGWRGLTAALAGSRARVERAGLAELAGADWPAGTVLWLTSPHRNPDGATLDAGLVSRLAGQVRGGRRLVLDEAYRWFGAGPRVPGADLVGSLHKLAGVGARLGWVHSADFFDEAVPELVGSTPSAVWQHAWGRFLAAGGLELLHRAVVTPALAASAAFTAGLRAYAPGTPAVAGPHRLLRLPPRADMAGADMAGAGVAGAGVAGAGVAGADVARADVARADAAGAGGARADVAGAEEAGADVAGAEEAGALRRLAARGWTLGPGSAFDVDTPALRVSFVGVGTDAAAGLAAALAEAGLLGGPGLPAGPGSRGGEVADVPAGT
jgi:DNA-binding transcriptional MocR family regulator